MSYRGRYAPSPTGPLHVGTARTALVAWMAARAAGGALIWRLEDLDAARAVPEIAAEQLRDLAWLGLDWDEGPDVGGPHGPYVQSQRRPLYEQALRQLDAAGRIFPCRLSRRELQEIASAPHGPESSPYPPRLRPPRPRAGWLDRVLAGDDPTAAVRFLVSDQPVRFVDRVAGPQLERVDHAVGDFVLRRRDGVWAYQLAVVVDDLAMAVTEVVRGADLLASTARQIQLAEALGGQSPDWAHVPLVVGEGGEKLNKRDATLTLASLREAGVDPPRLVGWMAATLGLRPDAAPCLPAELVPAFSWAALRPQPTVAPSELGRQLRAP